MSVTGTTGESCGSVPVNEHEAEQREALILPFPPKPATIDFLSARDCYRAGAQSLLNRHRGSGAKPTNPFIDGTPQAHYWDAGRDGKPFTRERP